MPIAAKGSGLPVDSLGQKKAAPIAQPLRCEDADFINSSVRSALEKSVLTVNSHGRSQKLPRKDYLPCILVIGAGPSL